MRLPYNSPPLQPRCSAADFVLPARRAGRMRRAPMTASSSLGFLHATSACCSSHFCFVAAPAWAQFDTAQVSGAIQDSTGGVLPGVDVVLVADGHRSRTARGHERSRASTRFPNVPVGDYRINATLVRASSRSRRTGVRVNAGVNIRVDVSARDRRSSPRRCRSRRRRRSSTPASSAAPCAPSRSPRRRSARRRATQVAQLVPGTVGGNMGGAAGARSTRSPPASRRSTAAVRTSSSPPSTARRRSASAPTAASRWACRTSTRSRKCRC